MRTIEAEVERGMLLDLKATTAEVIIAAQELVGLVEQAHALAEELEATDNGWPLALRNKCRLPALISERQALEFLFSDIDTLIVARAEFLKRPVEFPDAGLRATKTREAVARAVETGKPFGLFALGAGEAKAHIAAVKVSGLIPASIDDWVHVQRYIALDEKVISFVSRWNQFADELSIPRLEGGIAALRQIEIVATIAKKAHRLATEFDTTLSNKVEAVFCAAPSQTLMGSSAELRDIKAQLMRHLTKVELAKAATQLSTLQEKLVGKTGPVSIALKPVYREPTWLSRHAF
jgi:hypothetical protein